MRTELNRLSSKATLFPDNFATSSAVKAIAQQPEAHGKIRSTLLIGAALAEATAIYGFVLGILIILMVK